MYLLLAAIVYGYVKPARYL